MKRASNRICVMFILVLTGVAATAQVPKTLADPLFGILYDPQAVHFERLPLLVSKTCANVRGRYVVAWVYGHFQTAAGQYFLVSGLMRSRDEETSAVTIAQEEGDGTVVALRDSSCLMDQADYFFTQGVNPAKDATPIMASQSVLTGILQDAFERYTTAFGGVERFLAKVKPDAIASPVIRKQLGLFEKHHGQRQ